MTRANSSQDFPLVRSLRPVLELVRDKIGSTKVIKVPADQRTNSVTQHYSRLIRQPRGSFESMASTSSKATEFSFVRGTASGASATIFKGYQDQGLTSVAIKKIDGRKFKGHEYELQKMLEREIKALEELSASPFVTKFFEYIKYSPKNEHWMVMEFCNGGAAIELLKEKIPLSQISAIAAAVLRALDFIHSKGYIHGDIKCANVLLTSPGVVKVCDFGLASKVVGVKSPDLHALGTVDYMSPEVMEMSLRIDDGLDVSDMTYDRKIDIWAVGIIVLELLVGNPPMHYYRHFEEEDFSRFIAAMPHENKRQSGLFDLFFYSEEIHEIVEQNFQARRRKLPEKDFEKLLQRFEELPKDEKTLQKLFYRMSRFKKKINPASRDLFEFKPAEVVGAKNSSKMFALTKCLSFVSHSLLFSVEDRPEAAALAQHPFVKSQYNEYVRLENSIDEIIEQSKHRAQRQNLWKSFRCSLTIREINKILVAKETRLRRKLQEV